MDDGVHAVGRFSALTQVLDAKVTEGEKALDVLDGILLVSSRILELLRFSTQRISSKRSLWAANLEGGMMVDTVIMSVSAIACEWNFARWTLRIFGI